MTRARRTWLYGMALLIGGGILLMWLGRVPTAQAEADPWARPRVDRDLRDIRKDTLRVAVVADPMVYEERPGAVSGLEFELLERFAAHLDIPVQAVVLQHADSLVPVLQRGAADIGAAQLGPGSPTAMYVAYSEPFARTAPVLVSLRPERRQATPADRGPDPEVFWLPRHHPFASDSMKWQLPDSVSLRVNSALDPMALLYSVELGRVSHAILPEITAQHKAKVFPNLQFGPVVGAQVPLVFALRRNARELRTALDAWLNERDEQEFRAVLMASYLHPLPAPGPLRYSSRALPDTGDISPFDGVFRRQDAHMPWDWELLAAIAYKESRFDTTAESHKGAQGLMQMMPRTAKRFGLDTSSVAEDQVHAAARYLVRLDSIWMRTVKDADQRLCFVLASYNSGPAHVRDAQQLARSLGLDPARWEHNVERTLILLAEPRYYMRRDVKAGYAKGSATFMYVRDIIGLYQRLRAQDRA